jgi:hypothetical protein
MMRRLARSLVIVAAALSLAALAGADAADEYELKAAMYVNLLRLVEWPAGRLADPASPLVIGVAGSEDMARALDAIAARKSASTGRRITVKRIAGMAGIEECNSLFIGGGDRKRIEGTLAAVSKNPVLTVGESDRFISLGGMIDLALKDDDRVQIEVNLDAAHNARLEISSQVLKIAVIKAGGGK